MAGHHLSISQPAEMVTDSGLLFSTDCKATAKITPRVNGVEAKESDSMHIGQI
jgi:hypothetical protein